MIEELTHERDAGCMCLVVRVGQVQGRVDDEGDGTGGEVIPCIHQSTAFTQLAERSCDVGSRGGECG